MSIEDARARLAIMNRGDRDSARRQRVLARLDAERQRSTANLPAHLRLEFEERLPSFLRLPHWRSAQRVIEAVNLPPNEWRRRADLFYAEFARLQYSPDYSKRLIRAINAWGDFYTERLNLRWRPIPLPKGRSQLGPIKRAYLRKSGGNYREAAPLSLDMLRSARGKFSEPEYNWLLLTVLYGLRPEEATISLRDPSMYRITAESLEVIMPKILAQGATEREAWKSVRLVTNEQREGLRVIRDQNFKRPMRKKMQGVWGPRYTYYAGRKNFFPWMRSLGHHAYDIAAWLGHADLSTTRRFYDIRRRAG